MSEQIDGGEVLVRSLVAARVDVVFTLHGGHLDPIYQALIRHQIKVIDTRHEQAAGHAADGWTRFTRKLGVCIVTAGPGFTDALTAIANSYLDCTPTLFIVGSPPLRESELLPLQGGFDQIAVVSPISKWAHRVTHTERLGELTTQAIRTAVNGRPGPVVLEVPIDVLFRTVDESRVVQRTEPLRRLFPGMPKGGADEVIALLAKASRPAIVVGSGVWAAGAEAAVAELATLTASPVFSNPRAHGVFPFSNPLSGGRISNMAFAARAGEGAADFVLVLGARLGMHVGGRGSPLIPDSATVVQVDISAEEIGRNKDIDLAISCDCKEAASELIESASHAPWPARPEWLGAIGAAKAAPKEKYADSLLSEEAPIHPFRLAVEVLQALPDNAIVCADGGEIANWVEMAAEVSGPGSWTNHGYLGCLGTGLPFAISAQVAHPDRVVCCITGDGAVGFNFAEFDTFVRHNLPVVTVISNDGVWGMSAHGQDILYGSGRRVATDLPRVRYDLAAAGFGCYGEQVESAKEIGPAVQRALASGLPSCISVLTDPAVIHPGTMRSVAPSKSSSAKEIVLPYYENLEWGSDWH